MAGPSSQWSRPSVSQRRVSSGVMTATSMNWVMSPEMGIIWVLRSAAISGGNRFLDWGEGAFYESYRPVGGCDGDAPQFQWGGVGIDAGDDAMLVPDAASIWEGESWSAIAVDVM